MSITEAHVVCMYAISYAFTCVVCTCAQERLCIYRCGLHVHKIDNVFTCVICICESLCVYLCGLHVQFTGVVCNERLCILTVGTHGKVTQFAVADLPEIELVVYTLLPQFGKYPNRQQISDKLSLHKAPRRHTQVAINSQAEKASPSVAEVV
eukprot:gene18325-95_t